VLHRYVAGRLELCTEDITAKPSQAEADEFCDTYIAKDKSQYRQEPSSVIALAS
jgi:hypothetical protein